MAVPLTPGRADELCSVLGALADPVRLRLLSLIAAADRAVYVCDLRAAFALSPPTISHHLKVLREAGLTRTRIEGTSRFISLRADRLEQLYPGLLAAVLGRVRT